MEKTDISSMPLPQLTEWVTGTLGSLNSAPDKFTGGSTKNGSAPLPK